MRDRTIESVLDELREENHIPMAGVEHVEVMITYGDGRGGGRPSEPCLDAFEVTFFVDSRPAEVCMQDSAGAIERLRRWLDGEERGSDG
jgi:hypothetical protein